MKDAGWKRRLRLGPCLPAKKRNGRSGVDRCSRLAGIKRRTRLEKERRNWGATRKEWLQNRRVVQGRNVRWKEGNQSEMENQGRVFTHETNQIGEFSPPPVHARGRDGQPTWTQAQRIMHGKADLMSRDLPKWIQYSG
jgi:hypothetical protein